MERGKFASRRDPAKESRSRQGEPHLREGPLDFARTHVDEFDVDVAHDVAVEDEPLAGHPKEGVDDLDQRHVPEPQGDRLLRRGRRLSERRGSDQLRGDRQSQESARGRSSWP